MNDVEECVRLLGLEVCVMESVAFCVSSWVAGHFDY